MSRPKRRLVVLGFVAAGLVAAAAVVWFTFPRPDPMGLVDRLDFDALDGGEETVTSSMAFSFNHDIYEGIDAVREAMTKALAELGYSPTEAGSHTRPDGAQLEIDVTQAEDGHVVLIVTPGKLERAGELEGIDAKAYVGEVTRLVGEFFTALLRHLPDGASLPPELR